MALSSLSIARRETDKASEQYLTNKILVNIKNYYHIVNQNDFTKL